VTPKSEQNPTPEPVVTIVANKVVISDYTTKKGEQGIRVWATTCVKPDYTEGMGILLILRGQRMTFKSNVITKAEIFYTPRNAKRNVGATSWGIKIYL
jgi:hypothetical protein